MPLPHVTNTYSPAICATAKISIEKGLRGALLEAGGQGADGAVPSQTVRRVLIKFSKMLLFTYIRLRKRQFSTLHTSHLKCFPYSYGGRGEAGGALVESVGGS